MPTQSGTLQIPSPRIAWGSAAAALLVTAALVAAPVRAADKIGDCELFGEKGQFTITPAVPGQLTVEFNPPAPGWWNGDSIETRSGTGSSIAWPRTSPTGSAWTRSASCTVAWDALVAGQTRNYDLALSQASITDERKKVVDFSVPYFSSDIGVLVKKGKALDATSIKSAQLGVQQATTAQTFVEQQLKPTVPVKVFPDTPSMFTGLQANQADAVLTDTSLVLQQATMSGGRLEVIGQYATGEVYGAHLPEGLAQCRHARPSDPVADRRWHGGQALRRSIWPTSGASIRPRSRTSSRDRRRRGAGRRTRPAGLRPDPAGQAVAGLARYRAGHDRGDALERYRLCGRSWAPTGSAARHRHRASMPSPPRRSSCCSRPSQRDPGRAPRAGCDHRRSGGRPRRHRRRHLVRRRHDRLCGGGGLVLIGAVFLIANDSAVARTFFYLPLIGDSFGLILEAFWVNIYIFVIAEILVLIWGLVVAIARLIPGAAGQPIRLIATVYTDIFRGLPAIICIYLSASACR